MWVKMRGEPQNSKKKKTESRKRGDKSGGGRGLSYGGAGGRPGGYGQGRKGGNRGWNEPGAQVVPNLEGGKKEVKKISRGGNYLQ